MEAMYKQYKSPFRVYKKENMVPKQGHLYLELMWRLVRGNVLRFPGMFRDSYVWLQITLGNQMPGESEFLL